MKKVIRLTENDLKKIVLRVIKEQNEMSGQEVFELQHALNDYFKLKKVADPKNPKVIYKINTDARWGPATVEALKLFQKNEGISPDGVAGPQVYRKLRELGLNQDIIDKIVSGLGKLIYYTGQQIKKMF